MDTRKNAANPQTLNRDVVSKNDLKQTAATPARGQINKIYKAKALEQAEELRKQKGQERTK